MDKKIIPIQGYSGIVMETQTFNNIDFCYIDGVHTYDGTKHDFLSFLKIASDSFSVLFDDYTPNHKSFQFIVLAKY